jgi:hypothetical protein
MEYIELKVGEIIKTKNSSGSDLTNVVKDQLFSTRGEWLNAPSIWDGMLVPEYIKFRRPIKNATQNSTSK